MSAFLIACIWTGFITGAAFGFIIACVVLGGILAHGENRDNTAG